MTVLPGKMSNDVEVQVSSAWKLHSINQRSNNTRRRQAEFMPSIESTPYIVKDHTPESSSLQLI